MQIRAYRCWARFGDWVPLTLCSCLFRGVLWLGETSGLRPLTSCDVQIRAGSNSYWPWGMPVQRGLRALGGQQGKDRLTVI